MPCSLSLSASPLGPLRVQGTKGQEQGNKKQKRYIPRSNKDYGEFVVEKLSDINNKIIPLFEGDKLNGKKRYDF